MASGDLAATLDPQAIDAIFAGLDQCQLPGAAVAIAIGGVPVYRKGFGLASIELPVPLSPSIRMRIASTTKHFAALAWLLLCEDGLAGLDDAIGDHLPGLRPVTARATMRQLMGHTSGVRDLLSLSLFSNGVGRPISERQLLDYYTTIDDADFEPGTRWSYNNGGYTLLSAAIEQVSSQPLGEFLRTRIFEPVGMHDTLLRRWDSDFVPNSAAPHFRNAQDKWSRLSTGTEMSGSGGMVSTMDDMLRWLRHMDAPVIGTAETWRTLRAPHLLTNGTSTGYGLGLISEKYRGAEVVHHAGGLLGCNSQMIKVPGAGLDISIAVNRSDVNASVLALQVIDACVSGLDPMPEPAEAEMRTGIFVSRENGRVLVLAAKEAACTSSIDGGSAVPVSPDAARVLHLPAVAAFLHLSLRFEGDDAVLTDFGNADVLHLVAPEPDAKIGEHAGRYRSHTLDATLTISADGATIAGRHGATAYRLEPLTSHIWRIAAADLPQLSAILTFDADGVTLDTTRMRMVRFVREAG